MDESQSLAVQQKKAIEDGKGEKTVPSRYYIPNADIYETDDALTIVLEVPGAERKDLNVSLDNNVLRIEGRIDFSKYDGFEPVYSEYNVGHFARAFTLSDKIDPEGIGAVCEDGVLTLTLRKSREATPRRIAIQ
jgi:HSP20 family protein